MIQLDTEDETGSIKIGPVSDMIQEPNPVLDMGILCEALCTLIRICHKAGVKDEVEALRDCIKHLQTGFIDETYKVNFFFNPSKIEDSERIRKTLIKIKEFLENGYSQDALLSINTLLDTL
jgi:hypothetical protein